MSDIFKEPQVVATIIQSVTIFLTTMLGIIITLIYNSKKNKKLSKLTTHKKLLEDWLFFWKLKELMASDEAALESISKRSIINQYYKKLRDENGENFILQCNKTDIERELKNFEIKKEKLKDDIQSLT